MRVLNYKSDFKFKFRACDVRNHRLDLTKLDWEAKFYTSVKSIIFTVSKRGDVLTNALIRDGGIIVIAHKHGLPEGRLKCDLTLIIPDSDFPDGKRELAEPDELSIYLTTGKGDCEDEDIEIEAEAMLPLLKGEPGDKGDKLTYTDLTEQDKQDLIGPIKDSIDTALTKKADKTELSNVIAVPTENQIEDIEPDIAITAVRTVPQELTPEQKAQAQANLGISKMELFCDLFNAAAGDYGYARIVDGAFDCELNELKLTYPEAVAVYNSFHKGVFQNEALAKFDVRTNMPVRTQWATDLTRYAQGNATVEVLYLPVVIPDGKSAQAFYSCRNLRKVYGLSHLNGTLDASMFFGCVKLEYVGIANLKSDLNLQWSPLICRESLEFIVSRASNTKAITITVHADVYAKLTAEWSRIVADAAAKNITFTTAS